MVEAALIRDLSARLSALEAERPAIAARFCDVTRLAEHLSMSPDWIYEHAGELGGFRIGEGPRARWRFELVRAESNFQRLSASRTTRERTRTRTLRGNRPTRLRPRRVVLPGD